MCLFWLKQYSKDKSDTVLQFRFNLSVFVILHFHQPNTHQDKYAAFFLKSCVYKSKIKASPDTIMKYQHLDESML